MQAAASKIPQATIAAPRKPTDRLFFTSPPRFVCVKPDSYIQTPCNSIAVGPIANGAGIIVASREVEFDAYRKALIAVVRNRTLSTLRCMRRQRFALVLVLIAIGVVSVSAQEKSVSIYGTVTDPNG